MSNLYRLAAFTTHPEGGNPAGVWVGDEWPDAASMQRIAVEVGYSETAFVAPALGFERRVRYFSPRIEVAFCGHATIATGVLLGELCGDGLYRLTTPAGEVPVEVRTRDGQREAALTSVEPRLAPVSDALVDDALAALRWTRSALDPKLPPALANAGLWHLVLGVSSRERLAALDYDFEGLSAVMRRAELITLQLVWRASAGVFHARNPFPVGGIVEDPATGAAAAALGGYLRAARLVDTPASLVIHQGEDMGRPSLLRVEVPERGGIVVSGAAVRL